MVMRVIMPNLTLIRGLPGSGKSTFAKTLRCLHYEADSFFLDSCGNYKYDIKLIGAAHDWCYGVTVKALRQGHSVAVSNTFTKLWELDRYMAIPSILDGVEVRIVEMRTQYENIHGVPEDKLKTMASRWQSIPQDWLDAGISFTAIGH